MARALGHEVHQNGHPLLVDPKVDGGEDIYEGTGVHHAEKGIKRRVHDRLSFQKKKKMTYRIFVFSNLNILFFFIPKIPFYDQLFFSLPLNIGKSRFFSHIGGFHIYILTFFPPLISNI